jgi:hypothetical protein
MEVAIETRVDEFIASRFRKIDVKYACAAIETRVDEFTASR